MWKPSAEDLKGDIQCCKFLIEHWEAKKASAQKNIERIARDMKKLESELSQVSA